MDLIFSWLLKVTLAKKQKRPNKSGFLSSYSFSDVRIVSCLGICPADLWSWLLEVNLPYNLDCGGAHGIT